MKPFSKRPASRRFVHDVGYPRDLDQIEYAEKLPDGTTRVLVGIADVDSFVPKGTPIDLHAGKETCTVYTGVRNFPMLPEELSTGTTSLPKSRKTYLPS